MAPFNDLDATARIATERGSDLAAIIVGPSSAPSGRGRGSSSASVSSLVALALS